MCTSCEDPGLDCIDILVPPVIPLQLLGSVVLAPVGSLDKYVLASRPPFMPTVDGSELDRSSMLPWCGRCPEDESTEEEKESGDIMEHLWLLFLLFHWDRSCFERLESMDAWWRVAAWRLAASSYAAMAWGVWTRGSVWLKLIMASLLWGLQGDITSTLALERFRLSSGLCCWRPRWSRLSEWEVGIPASLDILAFIWRWWRTASWLTCGNVQEGWCKRTGGLLLGSSLDWKFPTAYTPWKQIKHKYVLYLIMHKSLTWLWHLLFYTVLIGPYSLSVSLILKVKTENHRWKHSLWSSDISFRFLPRPFCIGVLECFTFGLQEL